MIDLRIGEEDGVPLPKMVTGLKFLMKSKKEYPPSAIEKSMRKKQIDGMEAKRKTAIFLFFLIPIDPLRRKMIKPPPSQLASKVLLSPRGARSGLEGVYRRVGKT
jgi:hypothetical protein